MSIKANRIELKSWVEVPSNSDFSIQNLPFGIIKNKSLSPRAASRIGNSAIDLLSLFDLNYFDELNFDREDFDQARLNRMMKKGKAASRALRNRLSELLSGEDDSLKNNQEHQAKVLIPVDQVENEMPVEVGDYTDFYSSIEHATNVGTMFRDPDNALLPNWKYIPVGYHGRASSIILSGTPIHRPSGQQKPDPEKPPVFGPCKLLDFELEMAFITYDGKPLGDSITTKEADDYIFGMVLFNDWSARDIQKWEYVPLGPFLAKNFASSVSAWIVTLDALEAFRTEGPVQEPEVFPYLKYEGNKNIDINLEVAIQPEGSEESTVCNSNYKHMYWNQNQQLAHHTVNGCNINAGDMYASGTISGPTREAYGSMLELSWKGTNPVKLNDGSERKFIKDQDTVIMRGHCEKDGVRIGFGEVRTKVLPAKEK
ncbi:MAG: fumarylacetoacetase [Vicingaceae bacterium]